jgi:hypothetical protein
MFHLLPNNNVLKQVGALLSSLFRFVLECVISRVHEKMEEWKLNCIHKLLVYADDVHLLVTARKTQHSEVICKDANQEVRSERRNVFTSDVN